MRKEYAKDFLLEGNISRDPMQQFNEWMRSAIDFGLPEPNAMVVATATMDGKPSARVVLLKEVNAEGFVFFTNYLSNKGRQLAENPFIAVIFDWHEMERQVRIEGIAEKISESDSDDYFHSRPRSSQIGAWASDQSLVVKNREALDGSLWTCEKKFAGTPHIPRPPHWGGFLIRPATIEFWQGRPNRMHDRLIFKKIDAAWNMERLAP